MIPYGVPQSGPPFPTVFSELTLCSFSPRIPSQVFPSLPGFQFSISQSIQYMLPGKVWENISITEWQIVGCLQPCLGCCNELTKGQVQWYSCVHGVSGRNEHKRDACKHLTGAFFDWAVFMAAGLGKQLGIVNLGNYEKVNQNCICIISVNMDAWKYTTLNCVFEFP